MAVVVRKLIPGMKDLYLSFFEHEAFEDHEDWSACYCLESHLGQSEEEACSGREARREKAGELVQNGVMRGYLLFDGEKAVGWCNADDKTAYEPILENSQYTTGQDGVGKIKAIYCILLAPAYRGKGLAGLVIDKICEDAKREGYTHAEAYPFSDRNFPWQYHGPAALYEKHGFVCIRENPGFCIMRKKL